MEMAEILNRNQRKKFMVNIQDNTKHDMIFWSGHCLNLGLTLDVTVHHPFTFQCYTFCTIKKNNFVSDNKTKCIKLDRPIAQLSIHINLVRV